VAAALGALALAKLAWVRRAAPTVLSRKTASVLAAHTAFILAVPAVAAQLAALRLLSPLVLYGFWWLSAALPAARRALPALAVWTWMPSVLTVLHLWTVGYIHTIDFRLAFVAPFLLGLAATARPDERLRQLVLPSVATLVSLGSHADLSFHLFGNQVSPHHLAAAGACLAWAFLAWRDRDRWLAFLAAIFGTAGLFGPASLRLLKAVLRLLDAATPRDTFGWGSLIVIAAFVLLAAGVRRSLSVDEQRPPAPSSKGGA
jgi:hypothetical protein